MIMGSVRVSTVSMMHPLVAFYVHYGPDNREDLGKFGKLAAKVKTDALPNDAAMPNDTDS